MLGVSRGVILGLIDAGFVSPARGSRNQHQFSFQDLVLLRTASALQSARITPKRIVRSLAELRAQLPAELPLSGLRITAVGTRVAVHDRHGPREAETGQLVIDFEVEKSGSDVTILDVASLAPAPLSARDWLDRGEALEPTHSGAAEQAYRRAIELRPDYVDAYLNLGAFLCDAARSAEAVELYDRALPACGPSAWLHFNRSVALEDIGRDQEALRGYEACLALDPDFVDAYFNAARLLELAGDMQGALRHLSAYRRLSRS